MPSNLDNLDVWWNWDGDYEVGLDHDLKDTIADGLQSLIQEIQTVVKSESQDWELWPNLGANLDDFVGRPNNKITAEAIHDRIKMSIVSLGLVPENDLSVRIVPVHMNEVLIIINIAALPSPYNTLSELGMTITFVYDYMEKGIFFLSKTPSL